jgi:hypothetical protein
MKKTRTIVVYKALFKQGGSLYGDITEVARDIMDRYFYTNKDKCREQDCADGEEPITYELTFTADDGSTGE